ncbi:MAG TPA: hypothetical protein VGH73_02650 [Thermoanaerobaculia bacterium]|jgi:hypothetical protein
MTCRSTLLTFVSLLLLASLAGAAVPPVATADPAVGAAAFMTPAASTATSPGCAKADIPFLAPAPSQKSATCGSCSETVCAGYSVGTVCAYRSGVTYTCQDVYGGTCGGSPITLICNCWHGPLP